MWKTLKHSNSKYYLIRVEVVWIILSLFIVCMVSLISLCSRQNRGVKKEEEHAGYEHKIQPPTKSGLSDTAECYLCGNNERSLIGHYRGIDDLGIICINQWYVIGMGIRSLGGKGDFVREKGGKRTSMFGTGEGGDYFRISQDFSRGISEVEIDFGENSVFDLNGVKDHLCQECLDKLLYVMDSYGPIGKNAQLRDLCLIDFQTMELYTLQEHERSYYIRDYYVQIIMDDSEAEVDAFYLPVMEDRRRE